MSDDLVNRLRYVRVVFFQDETHDYFTAQDAAKRIEALEAALNDLRGYVSRADWHYLKPKTIATMEGKDE
jgi:hypothetical protein